MGYCSDVGVCLTFKNQQDFKTFAAKALLEGVKPETFDMFHVVVRHEDSPRVAILLKFDSVKWYRNSSFDEVDAVDNLWSIASDEVYGNEDNPIVESGRYIVIGEEGEVEDSELMADQAMDCFARDYLEFTPATLNAAAVQELTARDLLNKD